MKCSIQILVNYCEFFVYSFRSIEYATLVAGQPAAAMGFLITADSLVLNELTSVWRERTYYEHVSHSNDNSITCHCLEMVNFKTVFINLSLKPWHCHTYLIASIKPTKNATILCGCCIFFTQRRPSVLRGCFSHPQGRPSVFRGGISFTRGRTSVLRGGSTLPWKRPLVLRGGISLLQGRPSVSGGGSSLAWDARLY